MAHYEAWRRTREAARAFWALLVTAATVGGASCGEARSFGDGAGEAGHGGQITDEVGGSTGGEDADSGGTQGGEGQDPGRGGAGPDSAGDAGGGALSIGGAEAAAGAGGEGSECAATSRQCAGACLPYSQQCSCSGLGRICGAALNENCCERPSVPGGTFNRANDSAYPATVSAFLLDRFEVTVGRFRAFVNAGFSTRDAPPSPGAGANAGNSADVGWDSGWNQFLPVSKAELESSLENCPWSGWTAGGGDSLPMTCVNWYLAQAFCIWDGGRLPTEAEWNFAAAGGGGADGQRYYPWSSPPSDETLNNTYAVYQTSAAAAVGSRSPKGDAKWGHADMAGNAGEIVIDAFTDLPSCTGAKRDCANLADTPAHEAVMRGGYFTNFTSYTTMARSYQDKQVGWFAQGFRCAYNSK